MIIKAPAKINLFLRVVDKRIDGYHNIETVFLPLDKPCDLISIKKIQKGKLEISSNLPNVPEDESNLCHKAAMAFAKHANIEPEWLIDIEKHIPVAAGLGGGSSDAAAVLKGLNQLYPGLSSDDLKKIALSLGADVPFFLDPVPALAEGVGEKLTTIKGIPEITILIANPKFPVSAEWGYRNHKCLDNDSKIEDVITSIKAKDWNFLQNSFCNVLQSAVFAKFPIMEMLHEALLENGADFVGMSGSGPTLFAICKDEHKASLISKKISGLFDESVTCFIGTTIKS